VLLPTPSLCHQLSAVKEYYVLQLTYLHTAILLIKYGKANKQQQPLKGDIQRVFTKLMKSSF